MTTRPYSFVKLYFSNMSTVVLGPKSTLTINHLQGDGSGIVTLEDGNIRYQSNKNVVHHQLKSNFFFKSSNTAIGVRGTDFIMNHNHQSNTTKVYVFQGKVVVADSSIWRGLREDGDSGNALVMDTILNNAETLLVDKGHFSEFADWQVQSMSPYHKKAITKLMMNKFLGNLEFSGMWDDSSKIKLNLAFI